MSSAAKSAQILQSRPSLASANPEERLNADLKQSLYTKVPVRTKAKLKAATT